VKKECSKCHVFKKFSDFNLTRNECKPCHSAAMSAAYHERRQRNTRTCNKCGVEKGLMEFNVSHHTCKVCRAEKRRQIEAARVVTRGEKLRPIDLVPCKACGLRGHKPGDPNKCLGSSQLYQRGAGGAGLGSQWWV